MSLKYFFIWARSKGFLTIKKRSSLITHIRIMMSEKSREVQGRPRGLTHWLTLKGVYSFLKRVLGCRARCSQSQGWVSCWVKPLSQQQVCPMLWKVINPRPEADCAVKSTGWKVKMLDDPLSFHVIVWQSGDTTDCPPCVTLWQGHVAIDLPFQGEIAI